MNECVHGHLDARPRTAFPRWAIALAAAAAATIGSLGSAAAQTVSTPKGTFPAATFKGASSSGVTSFKGIKFAAPPTGSLRWAPPTAPAAVSGTINATAFGAACPQVASPFGVASTNEDCLSLNVFVPGSVSSRNRLPVMVFFYGGAFVSGDSSLYDPSAMASQGNAIVVTVNYRLGLFGYMASTALSATSSLGVSGNFGLLDQQFALRWVQQNISSFGGNANNVTIFGESAGGFSVCALLVAPSAAGLFDQAITESGPCGFPLPTLAASTTLGDKATAAASCNKSTAAQTVACLRALSPQQVLNLQGSPAQTLSSPAALTQFFPVVDGKVIPQQPELAIALGEFNRVPVIEGTNANEGNLFVALAFDLLAGAPLTAAQYPAQVQSGAQTILAGVAAMFGSSASSTTVQQLTNEILKEYPLSDFASPDEALAAVLTDGSFACTASITDELFSLYVPTFAYEFSDTNAPMLFLPPVSFPFGATRRAAVPVHQPRRRAVAAELDRDHAGHDDEGLLDPVRPGRHAEPGVLAGTILAAVHDHGTGHPVARRSAPARHGQLLGRAQLQLLERAADPGHRRDRARRLSRYS